MNNNKQKKIMRLVQILPVNVGNTEAWKRGAQTPEIFVRKQQPCSCHLPK